MNAAQLAAIKVWGRWHHLNEMTIAAKGTPSDSEIDFEVEAWAMVTRLVSAPAPEGQAVPPELCRLTFAVQHNPNCPSPWLVRLPGKGPIDMLPYGDPLRLVRHQTGDVLGFGKTLAEAASAALAPT